MSSSPSVKINYILSTLYEILCIITPFITAPYLSRVLGVEQIGINSLISSHQAYFCLFATLGTAAYGSREIARNRDDIELRSKLFWEIEILSVVTSLIALGAWIFFVIHSTQYKFYYIILTIGIIDRMFEINWLYSGLEQFKYTITRNAIIKILGIIAIFIFVRQRDDLYLFIIINVVSNFLGTLSMWIPLRKFIVKVPLKELKIFPHLKETLIYFIPTIATSIYTVLDKTLIGAITHEENQNGYYEQANKIISTIRAVTFGSLNTVMGSRISYLYAKNQIDEIKEKIAKSIDFVMLIGIGCCVGLIGVANRFVPVFFGPGYEETVPVLYILSPIVLIISVSNCLGSLYYTPAGKRKQSAMYLIAGAFFNLIANLLLIPHLKSRGAAIGSIIAELIITILYFINCKGFYTVKLLFLSIYKKVIAAGLMLLYLFVINNFVRLSDPLVLIIQVSGGMIIYFLTLLLFKDSIFLFLINTLKNKILKKTNN